MNHEDATISLTIDGRAYRARIGMTILDVARQNDVYIPTLCFHRELTPYGGCRICIVEVEGMRNLPTACTTPVVDGMVINTHTAGVQAARMEILQLFMSEHPSSCLICEEEEECRLYSSTIRKAGVTTGCRYCQRPTV
jgi:NADH dehydrogenase/NADH:ubiquinone oxidoreductase subunit G